MYDLISTEALNSGTAGQLGRAVHREHIPILPMSDSKIDKDHCVLLVIYRVVIRSTQYDYS